MTTVAKARRPSRVSLALCDWQSGFLLEGFRYGLSLPNTKSSVFPLKRSPQFAHKYNLLSAKNSALFFRGFQRQA